MSQIFHLIDIYVIKIFYMFWHTLNWIRARARLTVGPMLVEDEDWGPPAAATHKKMKDWKRTDHPSDLWSFNRKKKPSLRLKGQWKRDSKWLTGTKANIPFPLACLPMTNPLSTWIFKEPHSQKLSSREAISFSLWYKFPSHEISIQFFLRKYRAGL